MNRIVLRFLYVLERLIARGPVYQILALLIVLSSLAVAGGLAMSFFPTKLHGSLTAAIWWSFLHLTDTGYMGEDNEPLARVVAVLLTFSGAIFFLGGVIAILTTALDRLLASVAKGSTRVVEDGHCLLIGWNPGLPVLIEELFNSAAMAAVGPLPALVLLTETPVDSLSEKLSPEIRKRVRLVTRQGGLADLSSLERVDFRRAGAILLLSQRHRLGHQASDLAILKTLMCLTAVSGFREKACRLVLDLSHPTNRFLVQEVASGISVEILPSLEFAGRLLCQVIRNPGIASVYQQLLTDTFGLSLVMVSCSQLQAQDLTLPDLLGRLRGGTVIGFLREGVTCLLNFREPMRSLDDLVILTTDRQNLRLGPSLQESVQVPVSHPPIEGETQVTRILVIGRNEALFSMLGELSRYEKELYEVTILCENPGGFPLQRWNNLKISAHQGKLRQLEDLEVIPPGEYNRVCLLGRDDLDPLSSDAELAMAYAVLRHASFVKPDTRFVLDLQQDDNRTLFPAPNCDLLVSAHIGMHMLAQVTLKPAWRPVYEELFTAGGAELWLVAWKRLFLKSSPTGFKTWGEVQRIALQRGHLVIGYEAHGLKLNPERDQQLELSDSLRVLVIENEPPRSVKVKAHS